MAMWERGMVGKEGAVTRKEKGGQKKGQNNTVLLSLYSQILAGKDRMK